MREMTTNCVSMFVGTAEMMEHNSMIGKYWGKKSHLGGEWAKSSNFFILGSSRRTIEVAHL